MRRSAPARTALAALLASLLVSACALVAPKPACNDAISDVATEPDWRQFGEYREWTTAQGCPVRIDVISDRPGPAHCGFEEARVIVTGIPVGARFHTEQDTATFVRDPNDVFGDAAVAGALDLDAELPDGAVDTGLRQGGDALWVDPGDPTVIYLVTADATERWPRDPDPAGCA